MFYADDAAGQNGSKAIGNKEIYEAVCRLKGLDYIEADPLYERREKKFVSSNHYGEWHKGCHVAIGNKCGYRSPRFD